MKKIAIVITLLVLIGVASYPTIVSLKNEHYGSSSNDNESYNDNNFYNIIDSESGTSDKEEDKVKDSEKQKEEDKEKEETSGTKNNTSASASNNNSSTGNSSQNNNSGNQNSGSSSNGNSSSGNSNNNNTQSTPTPTPTPEPVPTPSVPDYEEELLASNESGITVAQSGNTFILDGSMNEKDLISGLSSGSYLRLKIVAPKLYSVSELNNMSVTLLYSGKTYRQASDNVLEVVSDSAYAYFYLTQEFMYGQEISIVVDWGDGNPITYTFKFNVNVIKKAE